MKTIWPAMFIIFAAILWGLDGVVLTPRLFNLDVAFVVLMLHLIPFVIMNLFLFDNYKYIFKFSKEDYFYFFLIALFGGALGTLAIVKALFLVNFDHLSVIVLLQKLQPVFAIILAGVLLREKIKKNFVLWASIAIIASYFLTFGLHLPNFTGDKLAQAAVWALVAAFSFGSATVFGKKVLKKYNFHVATFYRFFFTTIIMLVYVLVMDKVQLLEMTKVNWIVFLIIAFTTGSGAIFIYYYGLRRVKAITATICELFFPISAIIFDYIFNKHLLSLVQWVAAIVMIYAILKVSIKK